MTPFQEALDLVHTALQSLHAQGVPLCASRAALESLVATPTVSFVPPEPSPTAPGEAAAEISPEITVARTPAPTPVVLPTADPTLSKAERLAAMRRADAGCIKCPHLAASRTQVVFGVGNPEAELMFVGEAPGEDEDLQGEPFVGKAGAIAHQDHRGDGLTPRRNLHRQRAEMPAGHAGAGEPGNRKPRPREMETCLPYLRSRSRSSSRACSSRLGATAMEGLLGETAPMASSAERWHEFNGIPLMATYHPAYLLRNQALSEKRKVWEDMLMVLEKLGKPISEKQRSFFLPK